MITKLNTELFCENCQADTEHVLTYVGGSLTESRCKQCGKVLGLNHNALLEHYGADFLVRILTKPKRMTRELQKDLRSFLLSLPKRLVTKPMRVLEEIHEVTRKENPK